MIQSSEAYRGAIVGDSRRILLQTIIDIIDPDIVYGTVENSGASWIGRPDEVHDKILKKTGVFATLETDRWILNGGFELLPESLAEISDQMGYIGEALSGDDGTFSPAAWVEMQFSNVSILQACSVYFTESDFDGIPEDFTVEVKQGGIAYYTKTFTGNTDTKVSMDGFTVNNPDAIRVTVTKWSLPHRRMRIPEIIPGIYEIWDGDIIADLAVKHQGDVSCLTLPYGTCSIRMDNLDRRFEPRRKDGIFKSIEERQGIDVQFAVRLPDGTDEYKRLGMFYQYSGGWKTGSNGLTMQWNLVDIIGLVAGREFIMPSSLPTTLNGWIAAVVSQLGDNFAERYTVDPEYADITVTVRSSDDVVGMRCGDLLRYVCMATGTWPRADAETGYLAVEPLWSQGNKLTLDNMNNYPVIKANKDIAALIFTLNDDSQTTYVVSGNTTASSETKTIKNPFIQTQEHALTAARQILSVYGGNQYELIGRGDMASEIGDVDVMWLDESSAITARRIQQDLSLKNGVLKDCTSVLIQPDGAFLFKKRVVITEDCTWTAPAGIKELFVMICGGGSGGMISTAGSWDAAGEDGADGSGGNVWAGQIGINEQQSFDIIIGLGGAEATDGTDTSFGVYSSADGERFQYGYSDIMYGESFARAGVQRPQPGSGDGGAGGAGGVKGNRHTVTEVDEEGYSWTWTVVDNYPGKSQPGVPGVSGCVVIYYDKEDSA